MIARYARVALLLTIGCGSHNSTATDGTPPLGDCGCDGSGSGRADAMGDAKADGLGVAPDAPTDAPACDTTPSCPSGQWCIETVPIASTITLNAVAAFDNNDVFAVGDAGTIMRRRCNTWTAMTSGTTQTLRGVWASTTDVWAVGDSGTVLRFDGTQWNAVTGASGDLYGISGTSTTDVWIVSSAGKAWLWNGTAWNQVPGQPTAGRGVGGFLRSVSGTADNDVWVTGETAYLEHANDAALWTNTTPWPQLKPEGNGASNFLAVLERSATNVWITSANSTGTTLEYNGSTWTAHANGNTLFYSLWARADNDIWGAGESKVGQWNGTSWTVATPAGITTQQLWSVTGTATDVYVVGDSATVLHQD